MAIIRPNGISTESKEVDFFADCKKLAAANRQRNFGSVVFLDIDGVLNRRSTTEKLRIPSRPHPVVGIDHKLVHKFNRILQAVNPAIVISSSWRNRATTLQAILESKIDGIQQRYLGITPNLSGDNDSLDRGNEIEIWLSENQWDKPYAVLDDASADAMEAVLSSTFKTHLYIGLTDEIVEQVIQHLQKK
jgi:hypothetical protein